MDGGDGSGAIAVLGMSEEALLAYAEELIREHATQAALRNGTTVDEELDSPGFAAVRAAMSYTAQVIAANNAFITRHLLDLGVIQPDGATGQGSSDG